MTVAEKHQFALEQPLRVRWLQRTAVVILLFAITVGMDWKLLLTDQYTWLEGTDLATQVLPWLQYEAGEWHNHHWPLWDPNHWGGQPLIGQAQPGVANPINWLLFSIPLKHGWIRNGAMNWYFVLPRFFAALFVYLLCRDLRRSRAASVVAGCLYAFGGFMGTNDWPQMYLSAMWAPLVIRYLIRRTLRDAIIAGFFYGLCWLAGHHQVPIFLGLGCAGLLGYFLYSERERFRHVLLLALAFGACAGLTGAMQILPASEYGHYARRWAGAPEPLGWNEKVPYNVHEGHSTTPRTLLGIVLPWANDHTNPYTGFGGLALAILGVWANFDRRWVRVFFLLGAAGWLFSLGAMTVLQGLIYSLVPMVEKARSPSMCVFLFNLSCAVLCSYGIDSLSDRKTKWIAAGVAIVGAVILLVAFGVHVAGGDPNPHDLMGAFFALLFAAAIQMFRRGHGHVGIRHALIGFVILLELSNVYLQAIPHKDDAARNHYLSKLKNSADLVEYLRTQRQPVRVEVDDQEFPPNFGDFYGVEQLGGYLASITENIIPLELHLEPSVKLFSTGYYIGKRPKRADQILAFEGRNGFNVYLNPGVQPRVRVVRQFVQIPSRDQAAGFIADTSRDLTKVASLSESPPEAGACSGSSDEAHLLQHEGGRVRINARLECAGMLVLADTFFPGWKATVDGKDAKMYEPYAALRGVIVPAGTHVVDMVYKPASVIAGSIMTCSGFVLGIGAMLWRRRSPQVA